MFNPGDKYIHFTKYGGVNFGEVKSFGFHEIIDGRLGIHYLVPHISTVKKFNLSLDGSDGKICKINHEMTSEELEKWTRVGEHMYSKEYVANLIVEKIKKKKKENDNNFP